MKRIFLIGFLSLFLGVATVFGQDLSAGQVPSVITNSFQQAYPKAHDVEWKMDGTGYKVEFEMGLFGPDHDVWYDQTGKMIRHKEEISSGDLPQKVKDKIKKDFNSYRIDDVKKITEGGKITYKAELKTFTEEWKVIFDVEGNILSKIAD